MIIEIKQVELRRKRRIFVFSATCAAKKLLVGEKTLNERFFKNTGVVLAGIEYSPKIYDFRANGIPVQERVEFSTRSKEEFFKSFLIIFYNEGVS